MMEWEDEGVELLPVRLTLSPHSGVRSRGSPSSLHSAAKQPLALSLVPPS